MNFIRLSLFGFGLLWGCEPGTEVPGRAGADAAAPVDFEGPAEGDAAAVPPGESDAAEEADAFAPEPVDAPDAAPPDAAVDPDACPPGTLCVDLPHEHRATTSGAASSRFDTYGCAPETDESGPEVVYRVEVPAAGFLALELFDVPAGVDVDVHLLAAPDAGACLDRGHWRAGGWVEPGVYWVVADSWVDAEGSVFSGSYGLRMALTTPADLEALGVAPPLADHAVRAFARAWAAGETDRFEYVITDFSLRSAERRTWIYDLAFGELLWHLHVAHGEGSADDADPGLAVRFSNVPESHQSSLGLMRAAEAYDGDYGHSFRLDGLEPGYNDNARRRDIVVHPWEGSRPAFVADHGFVQNSWGCPAIDDTVAPAVVDTLAEGALLLFWYPDGDWSEHTSFRD